jgi:hypothetical protein
MYPWRLHIHVSAIWSHNRIIRPLELASLQWHILPVVMPVVRLEHALLELRVAERILTQPSRLVAVEYVLLAAIRRQNRHFGLFERGAGAVARIAEARGL